MLFLGTFDNLLKMHTVLQKGVENFQIKDRAQNMRVIPELSSNIQKNLEF